MEMVWGILVGGRTLELLYLMTTFEPKERRPLDGDDTVTERRQFITWNKYYSSTKDLDVRLMVLTFISMQGYNC